MVRAPDLMLEVVCSIHTLSFLFLLEVLYLKGKFNSATLLSMAVTALGVLGTILSSKLEKVNREELKKEIIEELRKENVK